MKKILTAALLSVCCAIAAFTQQTAPPKFALVIGNGAYTGLSRLNNPVNDANDMTTVLEGLGFTVDKVLNGSLEQMESAVMRLGKRLGESVDSYGFFFYAGHGVQSGGENFLIPADANIPGESFLRNRAVSVQTVLDEMNVAGNRLNVVVLDACRDNPFGWGRSGGRGLAIVGHQHADSIIVYATSAGQQASDGTDRNGLFTGQLLNNLRDNNLEVTEVFRRTGANVAEVSNRRQIPAVYNQFFGTAYLGTGPTAPGIFEAGAVGTATGTLEILTVTAGTVQITGATVNETVELPAWGHLPVEKINAGSYRIVIRYEDGKTEEKSVEVGRSETQKVEFGYRPAPPVQAKEKGSDNTSLLRTLGISAGTAFATPAFITTVHFTLAPARNMFLEFGLDWGVIYTGIKDTGEYTVDGYYSLYPFAHWGYFKPFEKKGGWYLGAGGGYMFTEYTFSDGPAQVDSFVLGLTTGFNIGNFFDISYTLRTNFSGVSNKLSAGFVYRFQ